MVGGPESLMPPPIEIRRLTFQYGDAAPVLQDVSATIPEGQRVAVVGPNGAGKSTLLWHLNGLLPEKPATNSSVFIHGLPMIKANFAEVRRQVGLLFQNPDDQLFCPTVGEDVGFGLQARKLSEDEIERRVSDALEWVGLQGFQHRPPGELSLGEKKRACLAGLLASYPTILALDEPTASLDPRSRRGAVNLLETLPQTMVIATHDLALAKELCHRVIILDAGVIRADGKPDEILNDRPLLERHGLFA
jgi:cobalt/nickel transport system ATP-binding protein